jgi:hypothetical protein
VAVVSDWRQEERERERDYAEREQYRARSRMSPAERAAEMAEQIESGELVIRTATSDERARYGMPPAAEEVVTTVMTSRDAVTRAKLDVGAHRHLGDELAVIRSASQRAAVVVQREDAVESESVLTAAELAREAGCSLRTVERAARVKEADGELFQKMLAGRISATRADDQLSARRGVRGG